eukprot:6173890-Pleurochrysis_carterae.AAC.2
METAGARARLRARARARHRELKSDRGKGPIGKEMGAERGRGSEGEERGGARAHLRTRCTPSLCRELRLRAGRSQGLWLARGLGAATSARRRRRRLLPLHAAPEPEFVSRTQQRITTGRGGRRRMLNRRRI